MTYSDELRKRADAQLADAFAVTHSPLHGEPTSYEAAVSMVSEAAQQCRHLYDALIVAGPMSCDDADRYLSWRPTTAGRRMPDLVKQGLAQFTGEKRPTRSGRRANVYRAVVNEAKGAA